MIRWKVYLLIALLLFPANYSNAGFRNGFENQVNIFSGEVASGLTAGAPLSVSSTGTVNTGLSWYTSGQVTSQPTLSTTTPTQLTGGTISAPPAGTYWIWFDGSAQSGTGGNSITVYIYLTSTATGESRNIQFATATLIDSGYPYAIAMHQPGVVLNGSQNINIFWSTSASAAQASKMLNFRVSALRTN